MVQQFLAEQQQVLLQMILEGHQPLGLARFPSAPIVPRKKFSKEVIPSHKPTRPPHVLRRREFIPGPTPLVLQPVAQLAPDDLHPFGDMTEAPRIHQAQVLRDLNCNAADQVPVQVLKPIRLSFS